MRTFPRIRHTARLVSFAIMSGREHRKLNWLSSSAAMRSETSRPFISARCLAIAASISGFRSR